MREDLFIAVAVLVLSATGWARADTPPEKAELRAVITKSLALLERSSAEYQRHRTCFSCHHQALPALVLVEARNRGFPIDQENLNAQLQLTVQHLERGRDNYHQGRGQGGQADTAGYALWTLEAGGWPADQTTAAVAEYLVRRQNDLDHWRRTSKRPPSEASDFTTTYLAIRGLGAYATAEQAERSALRRSKAAEWLLRTPGQETEDQVFRLRALKYVEAEPDVISTATRQLIDNQRDDGGWAQTAELQSDAYATGSVLVALHQAGGLAVSDPVYQRGMQFLIGSQLADGSWHVRSRSKPFQTYFESGFPHGKDQFISITASSWSTLALLMACPPGSPATQCNSDSGANNDIDNHAD